VPKSSIKAARGRLVVQDHVLGDFELEAGRRERGVPERAVDDAEQRTVGELTRRDVDTHPRRIIGVGREFHEIRTGLRDRPRTESDDER
jgi:hypothetical protein